MAKLLLAAGVSPNFQSLSYHAIWDRTSNIHFLIDSGCPVQAESEFSSFLQQCIVLENYGLTGELLLRPEFNPFQRDAYPNLSDFLLIVFKV